MTTRDQSAASTLLRRMIILLLLMTEGSVVNEAWATYTYRLLNSNNKQVAYCTSATNTLPSDMVSPLVANYTYFSSADNAASGTSGGVNATAVGVNDGETVLQKQGNKSLKIVAQKT